jgi:hypothetical protein
MGREETHTGFKMELMLYFIAGAAVTLVLLVIGALVVLVEWAYRQTRP